jgi:outer membrane protein OmpA-like peptidoglycan-associated protein
MSAAATRALAGLALAALIAGCAAPPPPPPKVSDRVVLLPQADGRASAVQVTADGQTLLLDKAYATAERAGPALRASQTTAEAVSKDYGTLLAQQPARPQRFTVQFEANGAKLNPEAPAVLERVRQALAALPAPEVIVTGHTDRVGSDEVNDKLSLQRDTAVREILVAAGFSRDTISVLGRGKREPLVPTDDGVAEPRNRRVEIKIR